MTDVYQNIRRNVNSLSRDEQLQLVSELVELLRTETSAERRTSILELKGLGKRIWQGIDAQEYVERERSEWNG